MTPRRKEKTTGKTSSRTQAAARATFGTRDRLIHAAGELILARSYAAVSVDEICHKAGALKGSLYHFFESKRDLVIEMLELRNKVCEEALFIPAFRTGLPPLEAIGRSFDILCELEEKEFAREGRLLGCFAGNLALEMGTQDEKIRKKARAIFENFASYFEKALGDAVAAGDVSHPDVPIVARQMVAFLEGTILLAKTYNDPVLFHSLCRGAMVLATQGVSRSPPRKSSH